MIRIKHTRTRSLTIGAMPFDRSDYPDDWEAISEYVRFVRAAGRCEWTDEHGRCQARHGGVHPVTGSTVVLTTAHLDHDPSNCKLENLQALCQWHHLRYDAAEKHRRMRYGRCYNGDHQHDLFTA